MEVLPVRAHFVIDREGPVTTTTVRMDGTDLTGTGSARCKPGDHFDPHIGADLSIGRALVDLGQKLQEEADKLVVSEDQAALVLAGAMDRVRETSESILGAIARG